MSKWFANQGLNPFSFAFSPPEGIFARVCLLHRDTCSAQYHPCCFSPSLQHIWACRETCPSCADLSQVEFLLTAAVLGFSSRTFQGKGLRFEATAVWELGLLIISFSPALPEKGNTLKGGKWVFSLHLSHASQAGSTLKP